ncbi:MAG: hypothetical protein Q9195_008872 [Heterodermia aff. obscurata]
MCYRDLHVYRQCQHGKSGICDKYDALFLEYQTFVSELRDVQARLKSDDETERQEALLAAEIIQCWKAISNHTDALRDVVRLIERFERKMQENREARMRELKGFRDRQGVWGDG